MKQKKGIRNRPTVRSKKENVIGRIAFVGCGFVVDYYMEALKNHLELELLGVMDRNAERASKIGSYYLVHVYPTLADLLQDPNVDIVVNLTNPSSHFSVSKAALEAGKHVYSEKPLAMVFSEAKQLVELAEKRGLYISSAPCGILGETAQTIWKALRNNECGQVRLVYAEIDDGHIHQEKPQRWKNQVGIPWPYKDEFEVGCTLEHAGYYITWLAAFFGPATTITAFSARLIPNMTINNELVEISAPDFAVACIKFGSGVVARFTCSRVAPYNHSLQIIGDKGVIYVDECWNYHAPVYVNKYSKLGHRFEKIPFIRRNQFLQTLVGLRPQKYPHVGKSNFKLRNSRHYQDFARGISELAQAITAKRPCRISAKYSLHVNEIVLAIQNALETGAPYKLTTTFEPMDLMPWAKT